MGNRKLGDTLRQLRKAKGYTQQQAAQQLGLKNKSTLGSWEVGKSEPDAYTFLRLCLLYDVTDIYASFEIVPAFPPVPPLYEDFKRLRSDYQELIKNQIACMLNLQKKETD